MSTNPFTKEQVPVEDPRGWRTGNGKNLWFGLALAAMVVGWFFFISKYVVSGASSINKDFASAYLVGDPWNGKIAYKNTTTAFTWEFGVYDTKTESYNTFATYKINVDPHYEYYYIGENKIVLSDYERKYQVTFYFDAAGNVISSVDSADFTVEQAGKKYYHRQNGDDYYLGIGEDGYEKKEDGLTAPDLTAMGVTDFKGVAGLKYSYWVTDHYARKPVKDASGAQLVLIEMLNQTSANSTTSFFALIDRENMKLKLTGYPNNIFRGSGYLHGHVLNGRLLDADHFICLTRDKVLKVQISTCKIEELATW